MLFQEAFRAAFIAFLLWKKRCVQRKTAVIPKFHPAAQYVSFEYTMYVYTFEPPSLSPRIFTQSTKREK